MNQGPGPKKQTDIETGIQASMSQKGTRHNKKQRRSVNDAMGQGG